MDATMIVGYAMITIGVVGVGVGLVQLTKIMWRDSFGETDKRL